MRERIWSKAYELRTGRERLWRITTPRNDQNSKLIAAARNIARAIKTGRRDAATLNLKDAPRICLQHASKSTWRRPVSQPRRNSGAREPHIQKEDDGGNWNPKLTSHTPLVIDALIARGYHAAAPHDASADKVHDFHYISPFQHAQEPDRERLRVRNAQYSARIQSHLSSPDVSLKSVLARFIRHLHDVDLESLPGPPDNRGLAQVAAVFDDDARNCLRDNGFTPKDVVAWAWILAAKHSLQAASRLHAFSNRLLAPSEAATPTFLLQLILLRSKVSARALRVLLAHAFDRLNNTTSNDWQSDLASPLPRTTSQDQFGPALSKDTALMDRRPFPGLTEAALVVLTIRLIRHARKAWPEALPYIARLFACYMPGCANRTPLTPEQLSFTYDKILLLLAKPSDRFYTQIRYHQEAQLIVIRAMGMRNPPLLVGRIGYRAVASVQLAHHKTGAEVRWAQRKSRSWPPWQEPRTGMDEDIDEEAGISRTRMALTQLAEAGYRSTPWEDAAGILAGWDTDNSPTIQTRRYLPAVPLALSDSDPKSAPMVWAARIRAVRTVEEAWAIFLSCQEAACDTEEPYHAMAEKLLWGIEQTSVQEEVDMSDDDPSLTLPGDKPETFEPSGNPRERPYLRIPIPSIETLLDHAEQRGVRSPKLLIEVLERGRSYALGSTALKSSHLPAEAIEMLLGSKEPTSAVLRTIDERLLLAVLRWLTYRFAPRAVSGAHHSHWPRACEGNFEDPVVRVMWAFRLVSVSQTNHSPAWTPLFRALTPTFQDTTQTALYRDAWLGLGQLIAQMQELDIDRTWGQFIYLCRTYSLATITASQTGPTICALVEPSSGRWDPLSGLRLLKTEFNQLSGSRLALDVVTPSGRVQSPPAVLRTPQLQGVRTMPQSSPIVLRAPQLREVHMMIQALGLAHDHRGIVEIANWMRVNQRYLRDGPRQPQAKKRLRRCFIAIRAFVEGMWIPPDHTSHVPKTSQNLIDAAQRAVLEMEGPNAWPSDEEVAAYQVFAVETHPESAHFHSRHKLG